MTNEITVMQKGEPLKVGGKVLYILDLDGRGQNFKLRLGDDASKGITITSPRRIISAHQLDMLADCLIESVDERAEVFWGDASNITLMSNNRRKLCLDGTEFPPMAWHQCQALAKAIKQVPIQTTMMFQE